jgi:hypothetical protein
MTTTVEQQRISPLVWWAACWLFAAAIAGYGWVHSFDCDSWTQRVLAVAFLALTAATLALSLWAMRVHKWWFLVIPLVVISLFALAAAVVVFRPVFFEICLPGVHLL